MAAFRRVAASFIFLSALAGAQETPQPAQWLPEGAIYTFQSDQPSALLQLAGELKLPGLQVEMFTRLGPREITFAMYPGENSVWVFDVSNPITLDTFQQMVKVAAKPGGAFYNEYPGGVTAWSMDGKQFFARTGNRLVMSNRGEVLKFLFTPRPQGNLASYAPYAQARQAAGNSTGWAFLNLAAMNKYPPFQKGLATGTDAVDLIVSGAVKQALREASWLSLALTIEDKKVRLRATIDAKPAGDAKPAATGAEAFTTPGAGGVLANLHVPNELASASLWRDLGKFYAGRDELFPHNTSGGILAENFMEIFFTGRDLGKDVFGKVRPQVRLVVARQEYDSHIGTPAEQYPAAALIFVVDSAANAEDFGEQMEEAWQKMIGLTNFTRGQQAEPGLILDRESHAGTTFTYGRFSDRGEKDRQNLPSRFNLRPAIVHEGPYVILSTTDALARDLIDAVHKEDGRQPAQTSDAHTVIQITNVDDIRALLKINQTAMVRQSVISKGIKPEQALKEFQQNVAMLDKIGSASLKIYAHRAELDLEIK